jgi:esterase/lipase
MMDSENGKQNLILLHGAIGAKDQLQPLANILSDKFDVHTINFSGHGGEPMPDKFSIDLFAEDVFNYLHQNKIDRINIFGYSMGGYVGCYLAKHYPEKVNKLFTFATKFLWTPEIAKKEILFLDVNKITEKLPAFAKALEQRHSPNDWKIVFQKTADMLVQMGNSCVLSLSDFETLTTPVMIGIGDKDTMVTLEETISVYRKIKDAQLLVMPQTQHPIEKISFERLANEINSFFL